MPFLAVTMGGWWIFVGALAGILSVPRGIHGWYFGIFTEAVVLWVRGYQGPVVNSLYNKKPPKSYILALEHQSVQAAQRNLLGE